MYSETHGRVELMPYCKVDSGIAYRWTRQLATMSGISLSGTQSIQVVQTGSVGIPDCLSRM